MIHVTGAGGRRPWSVVQMFAFTTSVLLAEGAHGWDFQGGVDAPPIVSYRRGHACRHETFLTHSPDESRRIRLPAEDTRTRALNCEGIHDSVPFRARRRTCRTGENG